MLNDSSQAADESLETNDQVFDDIYLNFWREELTGCRLEQEIGTIMELGKIRAGSRVLDLGSGFGRIATSLDRLGAMVTAVERSPAIAAHLQERLLRNSQVIQGDWHEVPLSPNTFDCALFWFTALVSGRPDALRILCRVRQSLRSGGILLIESRHWDRMEREFHSETTRRVGNDELRETHTYSPTTGWQTTHERYRIGADEIERTYRIRRYGFPELRELVLEAGFHNVEGFNEAGGSLSNMSHRAVLRATA